MIKKLLIIFIALFGCREGYAQFSQKDFTTLNMYCDSFKHLGNEIVNNPGEPERKNANYIFIKTLVSALKTPNSYLYKFDSV